LLSDSLNFITSAASRYIELASRYSYAAGPVLEQQNLKRSLKEMEAIKSLSKNVKESLHRKKLLQKIEEVYARIEALIDDVIPSFV
jgi:short-subunit dehydrogenase involved in D-alanine esterification of teichoic acids